MLELIPFTLLVLYIVPWVIAVSRDLDHHGWILALNLLLGWTVLGWFAALVLACLPAGAKFQPRGDGDVIRLRARPGRSARLRSVSRLRS